MVVNSLSKTVTRQRRGCDLNPGPSAPESSTLTTRLLSQIVSSTRYLVQNLFPCEPHFRLVSVSFRNRILVRLLLLSCRCE